MAHELIGYDDGTTDILLYDEIGADDWGAGISAKDFVKDLASLSGSDVKLRINSPGGAVSDGVAMYQALKNHKGKVTAVVEGMAASIATVIMLGADEVVASKSSVIMIHQPWTVAFGNAKELREMADVLDVFGETILNAYIEKTGASPEVLNELMDAESFLTAEAALELGLVDRIEGEGEEVEPKDVKAEAKRPVSKVWKRQVAALRAKAARVRFGLKVHNGLKR